jgi:hypothetical protein
VHCPDRDLPFVGERLLGRAELFPDLGLDLPLERLGAPDDGKLPLTLLEIAINRTIKPPATAVRMGAGATTIGKSP